MFLKRQLTKLIPSEAEILIAAGVSKAAWVWLELLNILKSSIKQGDVVMFKGSHGMGLVSAIDALFNVAEDILYSTEVTYVTVNLSPWYNVAPLDTLPVDALASGELVRFTVTVAPDPTVVVNL